MKAVFLFDLDNTLLDDHRFVGDFKAYLKRVFGLRKTNEFFRLVEKRKRRVGFADYLGTLERYAMKHPREKNLVPVARFLAEYPFSNRLFPGAISVLRALRRDGGIPVLFTEGNLMFQTLKINNAGLRAVFNEDVLIYPAKIREETDICERFPGRPIYVVDDEPEVLAAIKRRWKCDPTTILVGRGSRKSRRAEKNLDPDLHAATVRELIQTVMKGC